MQVNYLKKLCLVFLMFHSRTCSLTFLLVDILLYHSYTFTFECLCPSAECFCGFEIDIESINNNFLHCPLFAAPRLKLLSSAAYIFADR